jgi:hypothetical protein
MTITYIAIIGQDADKKHRAAKFKAKDLEAVQKAADAMKLSVAIPKSAEAIKLVAKLPDGKLLSSGKATVAVFKGLWNPLLSAFAPPPGNQSTEVEPAAQTVLWSDLKIGSIVVAPEILASENGWWKAEVIGMSPDKKNLTVKWLDAPRQAPTTMPREQVALLHPRFL